MARQPLSVTERDTLAALVAGTSSRRGADGVTAYLVANLTETLDPYDEYERLCLLCMRDLVTREKNPEVYGVYEDDLHLWLFSPTATGRFELFRG